MLMGIIKPCGVSGLTRQFSTTQVSSGKKAWAYAQSLLRKKANIGRQIAIENELNKVDPVLGRPDTPFIERIKAELQEPGALSYGFEKKDVDKLLYGAQRALISKNPGFNEAQIVENESKRREIVNRILDIKNGNSAIQKKLAIKLAREEFQRFPGDSGSSEVQAAVMTMKIQFLAEHIKKNKKDFRNIRRLRMLVQQRQSILKYLKRDNPKKYYWAIEKLGLTDHAVTMEFNLDRRYMQKFKIFGDEILVRESKSVESKQRRQISKQKRSSKKQRAIEKSEAQTKPEKVIPENIEQTETPVTA